MTTAPPARIRPHPDRSAPSRRGPTTAVDLGVIAACAVACSMPVLLAAGAAGAGAVLGGMEVIGSVLLLATAAGLAVWRTRRRADTNALAGRGSCFGRILAAYGGVFVAGSLAWGMAMDGFRPDRWDLIGAAVCLIGVALIMYAPRN